MFDFARRDPFGNQPLELPLQVIGFDRPELVFAIGRYVANDAYPAQAPFGWIALWEHCQSYSGEMPADLRPISEHVRGSILRNIRECPDPFLMGGLHIH